MGYNNKRKKINLIFKKLKFNKFSTKVIFFITGIAATMWFLIRVIPKPSRASYPCMRASAPIMSGFILYLISLPASVFLLKKAKNKIRQSKYWIAAVCFAGFIISTTFFVINNNFKTKALAETDPASIIPNNPIGTPHGIFPGRVVWVHDPDATNEDMLNTAGHYWYEDENVNQDVIEKMLADGIRKLTGQDTVAGAWNKLCEYFNEKHGKGSVGYTSGEKFFIKINVTNSCCNMSGTEKVGDKQRMDATPQLMLVLLKQLIEEVGVAQSDISIGDPYRTFRDEYWDKCHTVYPDVKYYDGRGINGRIQTQPSSEQLLKFSDGNNTSSIPQSYLDADYFINLPCLKSHDVGGITLGAKNHQGSVLEEGDAPQNQSAMYMHYSLPGESEGIGLYRHLVDYLGHKDLGGKTLITIIDAIWSGENWEGNIEKWQIFPFNNDYTSSVFLSQDLVAIESVCYDFLLEEYKDRTTRRFPYMLGADDYLYQAASSDYWPTGIVYDPEGDGTPIGSLGVFEHWNNATDMKYSKNLGTGNGIEFIKLSKVLGPQIISEFKNISYENTGIELVITDSLLLHFEDNSGDSIIFTVTTGHDSLTATITNNNILSIKTDYNFIDTIQVVVTATNSNSSTEASFKVYINTGKKYIAKKAKTAPVLDGDPSDSCWSNVNWTLINQVWLPYGSVVSANDFNGKYKAVWTQDSLYLLAEIYDDVLDVGNPNITVNYWQYDCLELFIDEDKSGGEHENNFNAFAYHLSAEGNAIDLGPTSAIVLNDNVNVAFKSTGNNKYYWEVSIAIFDDTYVYNGTNTALSLSEGKVMGFSAAYCDADNLNNVLRENFFGSVWVPEEYQNRHYQNADDFGSIILVVENYSNLSPYLISAINDIELSKNDTTFTIISNLNQIFKDIDDDILSFSVASDHDELAAVIENDTSLKITASALFDGTATIQVKASDNLLSAMDEFTIHFEMNKAPIKKKTIPDFEITELNTNQTVVEDLSEYFSDPNNDEITFTVSSDNDSISTRILNNSELLIKATKEFKSVAEVTVTASDGELSTEQTFIVTYQTSSIIDEITFVEQSVLIYPNPANEYINLKLYHDDFGKVDISIYDISGKLLLFQQFNKQGIEFEKNINLNNLSNGLYFIEISINNNLIPREIFIKN